MDHHLIWALEIIFTVLISLGIPATVIVLVVRYNTRRKSQRDKLKAEVMAKAIEHGQILPEDFFDEPKKQRKPLNIGIICITVGLAVSLFFWISALFFAQAEFSCPEDLSFWQEDLSDIKSLISIGIIPFLIGVAYVVIHFLEKKNQPTENEKK